MHARVKSIVLAYLLLIKNMIYYIRMEFFKLHNNILLISFQYHFLTCHIDYFRLLWELSFFSPPLLILCSSFLNETCG